MNWVSMNMFIIDGVTGMNRSDSKVRKQVFKAYTYSKVGRNVRCIPSCKEDIYYDLHGRVTKHTELVWRLNPRKKPIAGKYVHIYEGGKEIGVDYYFPMNQLMRKERNMYDQSGRLSYTRAFSPEGKCIYENHYGYDKKGNVIEMIDFNVELDMTSIYKYVYDEPGNRIRQSLYDANGNLERDTTYMYDDKGHKIKEATVSGLGVRREMIVYEYNDKDELIQKKWYDDALEQITLYSYKRAKGSEEVICRQYRFACDCTGVRQIPEGMDVTRYLCF